jgi:hypothetical protein
LVSRTRWVVTLLAAALLLSVTRVARAHLIGLSRGEYVPNEAAIHGQLAFRVEDVALAIPALDANRDGHVTQAEVDQSKGAIGAMFIGAIAVVADGRRCDSRLDEASLDATDGLRLNATYLCAQSPRRLHLRFGFLERMPGDHRHLATVRLPGGRGEVDALATLTRPEMDVEIGGAGASAGFVSLLRGGIEHILTGADHLAFLLALVLGATLASSTGRASSGGFPGFRASVRARLLVAMLTAFTVGHSFSLAIATLGWFAPGPRLIEPAVALSVAYVGAENVFARSVRHRWMLTLLFGVVHGFAFAGGLIPLGLPRARLPGALLAFNLGVEAGQLMVLAVLFAPIALVRSRGWYPRLARVLSIAIALLGVAWFFERIA